MTKKVLSVFVCDECGKEEHSVSTYNTHPKWFRLERITLFYSPSTTPFTLHEENILEINDETDPDFCSEECLLNWMKKEITKIKKEAGK